MSSRTSLVSGSRTTDSPVISLTSNNGSRASGDPSLGKRKRRSTRHTPDDEDPKPVSKKPRVDVTTSSASQKSRTKSIRSPKRIIREAIHEEEGGEDPVEGEIPEKVSRSFFNSKSGTNSAVLRIGPPRRRKKIAPLPSVATLPSPRVPSSAFRHLREEEEENTQEAAPIVPQLGSSPPAVRKKKRRLKPPSDARPNLPALAVKKPLLPHSRDVTQEPQEPSDQGEPFEADPPPPAQDGEPIEPLPEPTPPGASRQQTPLDSPVHDDIRTPTHPRARKSTKTLGPVPRMDSSHFKPHLPSVDTTSVIDEFSPKKSFPTQDTIESSVQDSQVRSAATKPLHQSFDPEPVDLEVDIAQKMQDVQDTYFDFDGQVNESEVPDQERPTTVSNAGRPVLPLVTHQSQDHGSMEQDPPRSQSSAERVNSLIPVSPSVSQSQKTKQTNCTRVQSFNSQKLEDALVILNQKSEEIEVLESRLAAQDAQIEHLQAENYRIQVEYERLSVAQGVQREALEEAKGTVSELGIHIDWLQDSVDKSEVKVKQLQGDINETRDTLDAKVEEHNLTRTEWEQERAALEARLASSVDIPPQQPPAGWELERKEVEDKLAEVMEERDQLDKGKRYAESEVESWKEQYRKEFMRSQELRREAKDSKTETGQIQEENLIITAQTKEAVKLVTAKYEAVVEKLKTEVAKAESLSKVLQVKDEQTGDDVRRRAVSATHLQEEVRRLREELASEVTKKATRAAELKRGKPSFLVDNFSIEPPTEGEYACQFFANGARCDQGFDSPQVL